MEFRRNYRKRSSTETLVDVLLLSMACCLAISLCSAPLYPQQSTNQPQAPEQEQEGFKIGVEVNLVTVPVTVRHPEGGFFKGLKQEAFNIFEDGRHQEILYFAQEGVPTRIAIVLDTSGSVRSEWGTIRHSTMRFTESLQPEDQFSLIAFNELTKLKMDWGMDTSPLSAVLTSIYCKGGTNLWDALWLVSTEVFQGIQEKKAIIIMSDGLDSNSGVSYGEMIESAVRSEAMVYVVSKTEPVRRMFMKFAKDNPYFSVPQEAFVGADLALKKLAHETGGRVLYPNSFGQLNDVYAEVAEELRNQYTLGYISTNKKKDGNYRRIAVLVDEPDALATARPGYYSSVGPSTSRSLQ